MSNANKEQWASRLGVVLAVAGNAIGLGNFLRFPRLAAEYGGGSFLIPYFIALFMLGIPLMWIEWTMGRYGGGFGHHTTPGMFGRMTRSRWGTIVGSLGVSLPLLFAIYYTYIESWTLAYATFSATGQYYVGDQEKLRAELPPEVVKVSRKELLGLLKEKETAEGVTKAIASAMWPGIAADFVKLDQNQDGQLTEAELAPVLKPLQRIHTYRFLSDYQGVSPPETREHFKTIYPALAFWLIAVGANCWILSKGISGGIEILAKFAMPLLFLFAIVLLISVFCYGTPDPTVPTRSIWQGLDYVWKPNFGSLKDPEVWLNAAGQIFFTLSIGTGSIQAYSCYLKKNEDCALTGLATVTTNEFAEVVLGGSIAIPIAVASFGLLATQAIAASGSFDLGFVAMPMIFEQMPFGRVLGTLWFALLFFAGITSSVGLCQPVIAFMQEAFGWKRQRSALLCGAFLIGFGLPIIFLLKFGYLDEYDNWVGTVGLLVFGLIETIVFAWLFGYSNFRHELSRDNQIAIPEFYYPVIRYVVPISIIVLFAGWLIQKFDTEVMMEGVDPTAQQWRWIARGTIALVLVLFAVLTVFSQSLRKASEKEVG